MARDSQRITEFVVGFAPVAIVDQIIDMFRIHNVLFTFQEIALFAKEVKQSVQYHFLYLSTITIARLIP